MGKPRLKYIDILRAFAILLVVMGHLLNHSGSDNTTLSGIIYSFHMPLFMCISGFVTAYSSHMEWEPLPLRSRLINTAAYIRKKFTHIMLPYVLWPCLVFPFAFSAKWSAPDYGDIFRHLFIINDSLWFLPCLFGLATCFALYKLGRMSMRRDYPALNLLLILALAALVAIAYATSGWEILRSVLSYFVPFFLGVFMGQYQSFEHFICDNKRLYTLCVILLPLVAGLYMRDSEAICGKAARMICGLASVPLFFYWFKQHEWSPRLAAALSYIGRNTLIIYILHSRWIPEWDFSAYAFPIWVKLVIYPALSLVMIVPILGINLILEQSALTRKYLLGRQ